VSERRPWPLASPPASPPARAGGSLTVFCGPTRSGKTKKLDSEAERAARQRRRVQRFGFRGFGPAYGKQEVAAAGAIREALLPETEVVAIDDAQQFDLEIVRVCAGLADDLQVDVAVGGWELDYRGLPVEAMAALLCLADEVVKLDDATCTELQCRNLASRTQRYRTPGGSGDPAALFLPVCRRHHRPEERPLELQSAWLDEPAAGIVELICGCMFSGKTLELIRRLDQEIFGRARVQVFKPALDTRYAVEEVSTHRQYRLAAQPVQDIAGLRAALRPDTEVVGIDEVQFFGPEVAGLAGDLADAGCRVLLTGLNLDFRGEPFGSMPTLMAQADRVQKLHASCQFPGCRSRTATRTQRLVNGRPARYDDPLILIGGSSEYQARCRQHHEVPGR
jgi:thymidine kinase